MRYKTWILLREKANEVLKGLFKRLGYFDRPGCDLGDRPVASFKLAVDPENGGAIADLWVVDEEMFIKYLLRPEHYKDGKYKVSAFSVAPLSELRKLDGAWIRGAHMHLYRVHCRASDFTISMGDPYSHRFVEIILETTAPEGRFGRVRGIKNTDEFESNLYFDPIALNMDEETTKYLVSCDADLLSEVNAYFLPPIRVEVDSGQEIDDTSETSYFAPVWVDLRRQIFSKLGLDKPKDSDPAIVTLCRMVDFPLLRDILLDGGTIYLIAENTKPTRWGLKFSCKDIIADYRASTFLGLRKHIIPGWSDTVQRRIGECLQEDLRSLAPFSVPPVTSSGIIDWTIPKVQKSGTRAVAWDGSYTLIVDLGDQLDSDEHRSLFQRFITWPAAPLPDEPPDHDLAERNLISKLFRCPWIRQPGPPWTSADEDWGKAWTDAIRELLFFEFAGNALTLEERLENWSYLNCRLVRTPDGTTIHHSYNAQPREVLAMRLLAPLGTVFRADHTVVLDDSIRGVLDRGFVLA